MDIDAILLHCFSMCSYKRDLNVLDSRDSLKREREGALMTNEPRKIKPAVGRPGHPKTESRSDAWHVEKLRDIF